MITKEMSIKDIIEKHPETFEVFMKHGLHCVGCVAAQFETLEDGAKAHNIDVGALIKDLNEAVSKKEEK